MASRQPKGKIISLPKLKIGTMDFQFLGIIAILLSFGLIMILSAFLGKEKTLADYHTAIDER